MFFADDTKCLKQISSPLDNICLQNDLDAIHAWSKEWKLKFNEHKNVLLSFNTRYNAQQPNFMINNKKIIAKESHRDLGVIISSHLSWKEHYNNLSKKSYRTLGLLRRTISCGSVKSRKFLYLSLVRSQITYCSPVWHPHLIKDIVHLEKIQKRATKFILSDYTSDYKSRLTTLHLLPLMMKFELIEITFF